MMYLLRRDRAGKSQLTIEKASHMVACTLIEHWQYCNINTITEKYVRRKVLALHKQFKAKIKKSSLKFYQKPKKIQKFDNFNVEMSTLFDIFYEDQQRRTSLEKLFCIKMTPVEWSFLQDIRTSRKQHCESAVDRKWRKTVERKIKQKSHWKNVNNRFWLKLSCQMLACQQKVRLTIKALTMTMPLLSRVLREDKNDLLLIH